jgi:hypothetical protein
MKRTIAILAAAVTAVAVSASALAAEAPKETPFPAPTSPGIFVAAQTVTTAADHGGVLQNQFVRGTTAVFRVFAGETKTGAVLRPATTLFAYVKIPGQPNLKLTWAGPFDKGDSDAMWPWKASWAIPSDYPVGIVQFKVLVKSKSKKVGSFVQAPVETAQLTVKAS